MVVEALEAHRRLSFWPGHLPQAGGVDDQDARLLSALAVLHVERLHINAAKARDG